MKLLYQNSEGVIPIVQDIGCFYRSCLAVAEMESNTDFDVEDINTLWYRAVNEGYINDQNDVDSSVGIINIGFERLGSNLKAVEVGTFQNGKINYYGWVQQNLEYKDFHAIIQKVKTVNFNTHFRVVNYRGKVIFDPYYPPPQITDIYYSILYNIS